MAPMPDVPPQQALAPRLVLASQSPRRAELLREAGFDFEQVAPPFDDPATPENDGSDARAIVESLALRKALSEADLRRSATEPQVILGADTVCCGLSGRLLGKPHDAREAMEMIRGFLGREHDVVTGVALVGVGFEPQRGPDVFSVVAPVVFGELTQGELAAYAQSEGWRGKAGGYNLFDRRAAGWPVWVKPGVDATAVVGLPMDRLRAELQKWGVRPREEPRQGKD